MGDRTALQAVIRDCPAVQRVRVAEILAEYFDGSDYGDAPGSTADIAIGEQYMCPEISCGSADVLAENLEAVPGISFVLWEDPAYQWLGSLRAYTPELGAYAAECTSDGVPVLFHGEVAALVAAGGDIAAAVDRAYGVPWLNPAPDGCEECGAEPGERCRVDCTALSALQNAAEDGAGEDVTA